MELDGRISGNVRYRKYELWLSYYKNIYRWRNTILGEKKNYLSFLCGEQWFLKTWPVVLKTKKVRNYCFKLAYSLGIWLERLNKSMKWVSQNYWPHSSWVQSASLIFNFDLINNTVITARDVVFQLLVSRTYMASKHHQNNARRESMRLMTDSFWL